MKNRFLMTTSLSFSLLLSIVSGEAYASVSKKETDLKTLQTVQSSSKNLVTQGVNDIIKKLGKPIGDLTLKEVMPVPLLEAACHDLKTLNTKSLKTEEGKKRFRDALLNAVIALQIFYEIVQYILPDEAISFFDVLQSLSTKGNSQKGKLFGNVSLPIRKEERNVLTTIWKGNNEKWKKSDGLILTSFNNLLKPFFKQSQMEKFQFQLLQRRVQQLKTEIIKKFNLSDSNEIFMIEKLINDHDLLRFSLSFGISKEHLNNIGVLLRKKNLLKEAEECFKAAADKGLPHAMWGLGHLLHGQGEKEAAKEWVEKAAKEGLLEAMSELGTLLCKRGEEKEGEKWLRAAADKGLPHAMDDLGTLFAGQGKKREAEKWFRAAAEKGIPEAMRNLGVFFSMSRIKKKQKNGSKKLLTKACRGLCTVLGIF